MYLLLFGVRLLADCRLLTGIFAGSKDRFVKEFSNEEIGIGLHTRDMLNKCEPWSQHLTNKGIRDYNKAVSRGQCDLAKSIVDKSMTETTAPWCIDALKIATMMACGKCEILIKDALPQSYY